jgi:hypothetical protein
MYLNAESVKVDSDDGRITLEVFGYAVTLTILIHDIDLDAFYDQVKARIGPYLRERDEAKAEWERWDAGGPSPDPTFNSDTGEAYELSDPKHPEFHSVHADIWDARDGK